MEPKIIRRPLLKSALTLFRLVLVILLFPGCATKPKPLYYWGEYEDLVYAMYVAPGEADTLTQVAKITEDIQKTHDNGQRVPPGIHAHLGYLYFLLGNTGASLAELETEKQLYPESTVFVNRVIEKLVQ